MGDDGRKMIYPITIPQRLKHFPWKFHWDHLPRFSQIPLAMLFTCFFFYRLQKMSYNPVNVKRYEKYLVSEEEEYQAHLHHLENYYEDQHN